MSNRITNNQPLNPYTLKFSDDFQEEKFARARLVDLPLILQAGLGFLVVLFMTLSISQSVLGYASIWSNLGYGLLGMLTLISFSFLDAPKVRAGVSPLPALLANGMLAGVLLVGLLPGADLQLYSVALLATLSWYWLFSGFDFYRATIIGWSAVTGAALVWLFFSNRTPVGEVLLLTISMMLITLFATLAAYLTERRWRLDFLEKQQAESARKRTPASGKAGLGNPLSQARPDMEWAQSLKAMTIELAGIYESDRMFTRLLDHIRKQVDFDAAAIGKYRNGRMIPVVMRDQLSGTDNEDAIKMLWSTNLLESLQKSKGIHNATAELGLLESSLHGENISFGFRLDIPYFSQRRLNGVVTLLRKRPAFNEDEVNLASSMVFHGMFAQRSAQLQQKIEKIEQLSSSRLSVATMPQAVPREKPMPLTSTLPVLSAENFIERAGAEFKRLTIEGKPVSLLLLEIDHHKELAQKYGEAGRKEIFATVTNILQNCLKEGNILGRYGRGSFAVQLPMSLSTAKQLAEGLRYTIEACAFKLNGDKAKVTVSIGVSSFGDSTLDFLSLLRSADMGLFMARDANGNSVRVHQ
jgi:diguanylate cyclase (GGDEF)-like protein